MARLNIYELSKLSLKYPWKYPCIKQNRKAQLTLAIILLIGVIAFFSITKADSPSVKLVDGVYHNECCSDVIIKDGRITYGRTSLPFKLLDMKFGLTGYVSGRFTRTHMENYEEKTAIAFIINGEQHTLSLPVDMQNQTFHEIKR